MKMSVDSIAELWPFGIAHLQAAELLEPTFYSRDKGAKRFIPGISCELDLVLRLVGRLDDGVYVDPMPHYGAKILVDLSAVNCLADDAEAAERRWERLDLAARKEVVALWRYYKRRRN